MRNNIKMKSYIQNLRDDLKIIRNLMDELLDNSNIEKFRNDPHSSVVIIGAPSYNWANPTDEEKRIQVKIKPLYNKWYESFNVITTDLPNSSKEEIKKLHNVIISWIEKKIYRLECTGKYRKSKR